MQVTLIEKILSGKRDEALQQAQNEISSLAKDLKVDYQILQNMKDDLLHLNLEGDDSNIFFTLLEKRYEIAPSTIFQLRKNHYYKGIIVESGRVGYGLYLDIGLRQPKRIDALLPLNTLRVQVADGKKGPLREIINRYCFHDYIPLHIRVMDLDYEKSRIWVELSEDQITDLKSVVSNPLQRIFVVQASKREVEQIIRKAKIDNAIVTVRSLGIFAYAIILKLGVKAASILRKIDPLLKQYKIQAYIPAIPD